MGVKALAQRRDLGKMLALRAHPERWRRLGYNDAIRYLVKQIRYIEKGTAWK